MSQNLPNWFVEKFDQTTVQVLAQQREARLGGTVMNTGQFTGNTVSFPRIGKVEMYDSARMARIALANADMDMIELSAKPKFILMGVWDPDKNKLNIDVASEYARVQAMAMAREEDRLIVRALASAAAVGVGNSAGVYTPITTIGDYATVADLDTIGAAIGVLGGNEMWEGQEVTVVQPFINSTNMQFDPYLVKSDVKGNRPWDRLNWRTFEELPGNGAGGAIGTGVDIFVFCRSAISYGFNDDMKQIRGREDAALTDLIGNWFQAGAVPNEPKGIVRIKSAVATEIVRKATPVESV